MNDYPGLRIKNPRARKMERRNTEVTNSGRQFVTYWLKDREEKKGKPTLCGQNSHTAKKSSSITNHALSGSHSMRTNKDESQVNTIRERITYRNLAKRPTRKQHKYNKRKKSRRRAKKGILSPSG